MSAPVIETARLLLRGWRDDDLESWADMNQDERVMEYFPSTTPRERSYELANLMRNDLEARGYGWFVMEVKGEPGFAGIAAVDDVRYDVPYRPRREIGWRLPVHRWHKGYATEAAGALQAFAFERLRWPHVIAMTTFNNVRSRNVMRKLAMTYAPEDDFTHPRMPADSRLQPMVLYRKAAPWSTTCPECDGNEIRVLGAALPPEPSRECRTCGQHF